MEPLNRFVELLDELRAQGRYRQLRGAAGADFTSNDYLALAGCARMRKVLVQALERGVPSGSGGSRLLRGNHPEHERLEDSAAKFFGSERALLFGSGYAANTALLSTLPQRGDLVLYDEYVHASVHDGMKLGRASCSSFQHNDVTGAEDAVRTWRAAGGAGTPWIAIESVYSMQGDHAPLVDFEILAARLGGYLLIDEAHATGVFGADGRGLAAELEGRDRVLVLHTGGKALGGAGAIVTGPATICDFLINRARPFIFATAPPPLVAVALAEALAILREEPERRTRLVQLFEYARAAIGAELGLPTPPSQILPIIIGESERALAIAAKLQAEGFDVRAIRPPTVPQGTARLRVAITLHTNEGAIDELMAVLREALVAETGNAPRTDKSALNCQAFKRGGTVGRMSSSNWFEHGLDHVWLPYSQMKTAPAPLAVARTHGSRIVLEDGRELIDGIASWWSACHGYNHPHIGEVVARQLERLPHVMLGGLLHEQAATLSRRLAALLPADLNYVFLSDSGSVAVEVAMKMAVQYWLNRGVRGRTKFVAFKGAYHGDTFATMSVCDPDEGMHALFAGVLPQHYVLDLPQDEPTSAAFDTFVDAKAGDIAAILVEPLVQGAGGMLFHDAQVLQRLRSAADRHGILLIFDEIFTGFGRTGNFFACSGTVTPDIVTLGKALSGGTLPLAATIANRRVYEAFLSDDPQHALMHGPTFMGNALACSAANASLDLFEREDRLSQVREIERQLTLGLAECREINGIKDVRVRGAIGVVQLSQIGDLNELKRRFVAAGVWVRPFRNIVYLTPALNISEDDLSRLVAGVIAVLKTRA